METEVKNSNSFYKILSLILFLVLIGVLVYFLFFNKKEDIQVTPQEPEKPIEKGRVYYDKDSYKCYEGEQIRALITATYPNDVAKVSEYNSDNTNVATISKHPTESVRCINCLVVQITCVKEGTTNLVAKSDRGATTSVPITVEKKEEVAIGKISYDKETFSCHEGEKLTSIIKAEGSTGGEDGIKIATVASYNSSNLEVATVTKHPNLAVNCINCVAVEITCHKKGDATLTATSSLGAKTSVPINVDSSNIVTNSSIEYEEKSYSCKVGEKITAVIKAHGEQKDGENVKFAMVSSYDSSDRSIATVTKHPNLAVNCINCVAVEITCKKEGKTTLKATSSFNDKTSVPITVK